MFFIGYPGRQGTKRYFASWNDFYTARWGDTAADNGQDAAPMRMYRKPTGNRVDLDLVSSVLIDFLKVVRTTWKTKDRVRCRRKSILEITLMAIINEGPRAVIFRIKTMTKIAVFPRAGSSISQRKKYTQASDGVEKDSA